MSLPPMNETQIALYRLHRLRMDDARGRFMERTRRRLGLKDDPIGAAIAEELWRSFTDGYIAGYDQSQKEDAE